MSRPVIVLPQRARPTTKKDFNNQTRTNYQTWLSNDANKKQQQDWEGTQEKAFTRWVNARLESRNISVNSLTKDLADGLVLHALIEQLSGLKFKINNSPKMRVHMTENVSVCLNILQKEGLKLTGIGAPNIVDGDKKLVLGLLANLIEFYQLAEDRQAREGQEQLTKQELKNELLEWCKGYLPQYNIQNFTTSWQSGKEICALVEAVKPGTLDVPNCFSDDPVLDAFLGIDAATEHMKIPPLIDASDMVEKPDDLAMMVYLSYFRHYANRPIEAVVVKTNDDKLGAGKKTGPEIAVTPCVIMTPVADQPMTIYKVVSQDPDFDKSKIGFTGTDGKGQPAKCEVNNSGYGVHEMVFTPTVGGNHTFKITYDGKPCGGIPQEGVSIEFPNPEKPKEAAPVRPTARPTNNAPTQRRENFATVAFLEKVNDKSLNNKNNYMVMIDKSSSMKAPAKTHRHRWGQSSVVVASLTSACLSTSPEGISVFFFGSKGKLDYHQGIKSQQQVVDMFTKTKPFGTTCLEGALAAGFKVHFARDVQARMTIPTVILVITDGEPDSKSAVVDEIISASKKCKGPGELSISFLQVGDDAMCDAFFKKLNKPKSKAKYANVAVDCLSYSQINNIDEFVSASLH